MLCKYCEIGDTHKELHDFTHPKKTTKHIYLPPCSIHKASSVCTRLLPNCSKRYTCLLGMWITCII